MGVLERQLRRVGLTPADVVSGTGDGGGENEGISGVHSLFEWLCPGRLAQKSGGVFMRMTRTSVLFPIIFQTSSGSRTACSSLRGSCLRPNSCHQLCFCPSVVFVPPCPVRGARVFEHITPSYVRRRCLGHIGWRTTDAGINEAGFRDSNRLFGSGEPRCLRFLLIFLVVFPTLPPSKGCEEQRCGDSMAFVFPCG